MSAVCCMEWRGESARHFTQSHTTSVLASVLGCYVPNSCGGALSRCAVWRWWRVLGGLGNLVEGGREGVEGERELSQCIHIYLRYSQQVDSELF